LQHLIFLGQLTYVPIEVLDLLLHPVYLGLFFGVHGVGGLAPAGLGFG
jgi:hypothetical protein